MDNGDIYEGMFHTGVYNGFGLYYDCEANKFTFGKFVKSALEKIFQNGNKLPFNLISSKNNKFLAIKLLHFLRKIQRDFTHKTY